MNTVIKTITILGILFLNLVIIGELKSQENTQDAYNKKGMEFYNQGSYRDAIIEFSKAIELNPSDSILYYNRALSYYKNNLFDEAITDFTSTIGLDPNYSRSYIGRGNAFEDKGDYSNALNDYNTALELDP